MFAIACSVTTELSVCHKILDGMLHTVFYPHLQDRCSLYLFLFISLSLFSLLTNSSRVCSVNKVGAACISDEICTKTTCQLFNRH